MDTFRATCPMAKVRSWTSKIMVLKEDSPIKFQVNICWILIQHTSQKHPTSETPSRMPDRTTSQSLELIARKFTRLTQATF